MENSSKENTRIIKQYCECGGRWLVEVIRERSDDKMTYTKLKCLGTIRQPSKFPKIETGEEFEVACAINYNGWVGWSLIEDD